MAFLLPDYDHGLIAAFTPGMMRGRFFYSFVSPLYSIIVANITMDPYVTPTTNLELPVSLLIARRINWLIFALCVTVAACGVLWLTVLYISSVVQLPDVYARLANSISEAQDISALKSACLAATHLDEADWTSRRNWIVIAPTLALILAVVGASLSAWLLFTLRRIERFIGGLRRTQAG